MNLLYDTISRLIYSDEPIEGIFEILTTQSDFSNIQGIGNNKIYGAALVDANGQFLYKTNDNFKVEKTSTGRYIVKWQDENKYMICHCQLEEPLNTRDDINIGIYDRTENTLSIHITEQDNGGTAGIYRDKSFNLILINN